jgi:hypothetical protein
MSDADQIDPDGEPTELLSRGGDVEVEGEQDAPAVEELDAETKARRDAALAHVRKLGDPVLRASALPVERFDEELAREAERMGELMHDALGVGLAATQVGILHRMLVYRAYSDDPLTSSRVRRDASACPASTSRWSAMRRCACGLATSAARSCASRRRGLTRASSSTRWTISTAC